MPNDQAPTTNENDMSITSGGGNPPSSAAPQGTGASTDPASGGHQTSWMDSLPDDLKGHPSLKLFKDPAGLAKSYISAQEMVGKEKVVIPNEKSTTEDIANFYNKIGRPETADKYDFGLPQGVQIDETFSKEFRDIAHSNGLTNKQAAGLVKWYMDKEQSTISQMETKRTNEIRSLVEKYKMDLGGDEPFKQEVEKARLGVQAVTDEDFRKFLNENNLASHPKMIGFFSKIAKMLDDGKVHDNTGVVDMDTLDEINREIAEIEAPDSPIWSIAGSPRKDDLIAKRQKLYEKRDFLRNPEK